MSAPTLDELAERYTIEAAWRDLNLAGEPLRVCKSPFREDRNPSFSIFDNGRRWRDFASDEAGRVFDFVAKALACDFAEAVRWIEQRLGIDSASDAMPARAVQHTKPDAHTVKTEAAPEYRMSKEELAQAVAMAARLAEDCELCERIAKARGWTAETVRNLAHEPCLGWNDEHGALAFIFDSGVKLRRREPNGERRIWWHIGKPSLWRACLLRGIQNDADKSRTVVVCEGETDAITAIDDGCEDDGKTHVVALPSASTFAAGWLPLFAGQGVILALDDDKAGHAATERVARMLEGTAASVRTLNFKKLMTK